MYHSRSFVNRDGIKSLRAYAFKARELHTLPDLLPTMMASSLFMLMHLRLEDCVSYRVIHQS